MTDIDALIAEVECLREYHQHWPYYSRLIAALTAERARVVELEAALAFAKWQKGQKQEALDYAEQRIKHYCAALTAHIEAREGKK